MSRLLDIFVCKFMYMPMTKQAGHFEDHLGCCRECRKVLDCSFFTFDYNSGVCYLKSGKGAENPKLGLVSGMAQQAAMS